MADGWHTCRKALRAFGGSVHGVQIGFSWAFMGCKWWFGGMAAASVCYSQSGRAPDTITMTTKVDGFVLRLGKELVRVSGMSCGGLYRPGLTLLIGLTRTAYILCHG